MEYFSYNSEPKSVEFKRGVDASWTLQERLIIAAYIANGRDEKDAVQEVYNKRYNVELDAVKSLPND